MHIEPPSDQHIDEFEEGTGVNKSKQRINHATENALQSNDDDDGLEMVSVDDDDYD